MPKRSRHPRHSNKYKNIQSGVHFKYISALLKGKKVLRSGAKTLSLRRIIQIRDQKPLYQSNTVASDCFLRGIGR